jgi:hypothetical protein
MEWLKAIAPTIFTAISGPLGGLAYEAISKVFNISADDAKDLLESGKMTSDQIAQVKVAEIQLKQTEETLGLNFEQLMVNDRTSARSMEVATKSNIPPILAAFIVGGFLIITAMKVGGAPIASDPMINDLFTTLRDGVIMVLSYYFGSSSGSQRKDELLYKSTPTP